MSGEGVGRFGYYGLGEDGGDLGRLFGLQAGRHRRQTLHQHFQGRGIPHVGHAWVRVVAAWAQRRAASWGSRRAATADRPCANAPGAWGSVALATAWVAPTYSSLFSPDQWTLVREP